MGIGLRIYHGILYHSPSNLDLTTSSFILLSVYWSFWPGSNVGVSVTGTNYTIVIDMYLFMTNGTELDRYRYNLTVSVMMEFVMMNGVPQITLHNYDC